MIFDRIENMASYTDTDPRFKKVFDFLSECIAEPKAPGRYEISGKEIVALVAEYLPEEKEEPRYETHDRSIDIQFIQSGSEYHWYTPRSELGEGGPYNAEKDITFYGFNGQGNRLHMKQGYFAVYFPQDGHLPAMPDGSEEECVRIVVKVK